MAPYVYIWTYRVRPGFETEFRKHYDTMGTWVQLFRKADGYVGTQLYQDLNDPTRFLTVDTWESREAFDKFRSDHSDEFEALDSACEALTEQEAEIGRFRPVGGLENK